MDREMTRRRRKSRQIFSPGLTPTWPAPVVGAVGPLGPVQGASPRAETRRILAAGRLHQPERTPGPSRAARRHARRAAR